MGAELGFAWVSWVEVELLALRADPGLRPNGYGSNEVAVVELLLVMGEATPIASVLVLEVTTSHHATSRPAYGTMHDLRLLACCMRVDDRYRYSVRFAHMECDLLARGLFLLFACLSYVPASLRAARWQQVT
jgi:hypothetical protein